MFQVKLIIKILFSIQTLNIKLPIIRLLYVSYIVESVKMSYNKHKLLYANIILQTRIVIKNISFILKYNVIIKIENRLNPNYLKI